MKKLFLALALLLAGPAVATTFHVKPTGSDTTCNGLSTATPPGSPTGTCAFANPQKCLDVMNAGDTCLLGTGTYTTSPHFSGGDFLIEPDYRIDGMVGSVTQPYSIRAETGASPVMCANRDGACSLTGVVFGTHYSSAGTVAAFWDIGPGILFKGRVQFDHTADMHIHGNEFQGAGNFDNDTNCSNLQLYDSPRNTIDHNIFRSVPFTFGGGSGQGRCAGSNPYYNVIHMFNSDDTLVEYNTFVTDPGGHSITWAISMKDGPKRWTVRYNDIQASVYTTFQQNHGQSTGNRIYGNLFRGGFMHFWHWDDGTEFFNNTLVDGGLSWNPDGDGNAATNTQVYNNIISGGYMFDCSGSDCNALVANWGAVSPWSQKAGYDVDYNVYHTGSSYQSPGGGPAPTTDLATWRTSFGHDANSVTSAGCSFTAGADTPYHITPGTPCAAAASGRACTNWPTCSTTATEFGAYGVTACVGHTCGSTPPPVDTTPPSQVTGAGAVAASSTQINVTWAAATDNVGVTGYRIERCALTGCTPSSEVGSVGAVLNFNDSGLAPSTLYRYRVRAQDAAGNLGAYSSTVQATTQALQVYCPAGGACSNEPACATAAFCEDWEDGNHVGWDWDSSWDACTTIVGAGGFNSANALKHHINTNACECGYPGTNLSLSAQTNPVFMRFYVKYSPGYQFFSNEIIGEKLIYFRSLVGGNSVWRNEMAVGSKNGAGDRSVGHINVDDGTHDVWWFQNVNLPEKSINSGVWYCIEWEIKANTPSQADGFFKVWLDDTQIMDVNNVNLNSTGDPIVMAPWISEYYGGNPCQTHQAQDIWYDQIVTSRQRIGCAGAPPPTAVCGNGIPEAGEACDDGNQTTEIACPYGTPSCTLCNATCTQVLNLTGPYCQDGQVTDGEFCDQSDLGGHTCAEVGCAGNVPTCNLDCGSVSTATCSSCGLLPIALRQVHGGDYGTTCTVGPAGFTLSPLANSLIVVAIRGGVISPTTSHSYTVTDSRGNTYRQAVRGDMVGDTVVLTMFYATNATEGSLSVTINDVVCGSVRAAFMEYTGVERGGGALDSSSVLQEDVTATPGTPPLQTQAQGDLVLALFSVSGTADFTAGTGWAEVISVPAGATAKMMVEDRLVAAAYSSVEATATVLTSTPWGGIAVAFRPPVVTVPSNWRRVRGVTFK